MGAPGGPKTGGRKKGTPNKVDKELLDRIELAVAEEGCPLRVLLKIANGKIESDPSTRMKAAGEACKYVYPQKKIVDGQVMMVQATRPLINLTDEELDAL